MEPKKYLYKLALAVSKRSGISISTCQVVIPALFDEMRYMLCEGQYRCVSVESFGTLTVKELPKRHYNRWFPDGHVEAVDLPNKLTLKFLPSHNMRQEVEQSKFDPSRHAFALHPDDHPLRTRRAVGSKAKKPNGFRGIDGFVKKDERLEHPQSIRILGDNQEPWQTEANTKEDTFGTQV